MKLKKYTIVASSILTLFFYGCSQLISNMDEFEVGYEVGNNAVFYYWYPYGDGGIEKIEISEADPSSFEILSNNYGKDKNSVFYETTRINGAAPSSFFILNGSLYSKDDNEIFYASIKIPNVNFDTFEPVSYTTEGTEKASHYGKDQYIVYWAGDKILDSDPNSFKALDSEYGKDQHYVYWQGEKLDKLDVDSFSFVKNGDQGTSPRYVKDKYGVYSLTVTGPKTIELSQLKAIEDPLTFEMINTSKKIGKDKYNIYWEGKKLENADVESFTVLSSSSEIVTSFNFSDYAKDKSHIFFKANVIPDADVSTFKVLYGNHAQDKNGEYEEGKKYK